MPELDLTKRLLTWTVYATPLMTLTTDLGLSIRVSMFEYVRLVTATSFGSDHCPGRYKVSDFSSQFLRNRTRKCFPLKSDKDSGCISVICRPSPALFWLKTRKKTENFEIGQLCPKSDKKLVPPWTVIRILELGKV